MKQCFKCKQNKDYIYFSKNKSKKDGYCNQCKKCQKIYHDKHYLNNKSDYLNRNKDNKLLIKQFIIEFKKDKSCIKCGESHPACLQFHHRDKNNKKFEISHSHSYTITTILKEIEKCDILCANCHFKLHYNENLAT